VRLLDAHVGAPPSSALAQHVAPCVPHAHIFVDPPSGTTHAISSLHVVPLQHASLGFPHSQMPLALQVKSAPHDCDAQHCCPEAPQSTHAPLEHVIM
jgi:hypothetical protein